MWGFLSQTIILLFSILVFTVIVNSRMLTVSTALLKEWAQRQTPLSEHDRMELIREGYRRLDLYETLLRETFLEDGMVVNRTISGEALDLCDSLLFSSLRFAALKKLGRNQEAEQAWKAIEQSRDDEHWARHLRCHESLSRDMLVGLLIALSQMPDHRRFYLQDLAESIKANFGFFSHGPYNISFLTPDMKNTLDGLLILEGIEKFQLFWFDFSSLDWQVLLANDGYQSHLIALQIWLEDELRGIYSRKGRTFEEPVSPSTGALSLLNIFTREPINHQRLQWITHNLYAGNRQNLFFKWLHMKISGLLDDKMKFILLKELLDMPQFPKQHLPRDCDRKADYLWQRGSKEYNPNVTCTMVFNGVDFVWILALLLES